MEAAVKDFTSGVASGVAQVFVMQPFQIIKIRLANQSLKNPEYKGILDCFKKIKHTDGVKGLYKGTLSPLLGIGPQVAMQFATNQFVKKAIRRLNQSNGQNRMLSFKQALASGFLTGIPSALLVTPIDLIRIQMQAKGSSEHFKSTSDAAKYILRKKGIQGAYLGLYPTLIRQTIALSVYFGNYEYGKNLILSKLGNSSQDEISLFASFILGGISGAASWFFTYPIDYIKTIIQSQHIDKLDYKSATQCALMKYREEGFKTFVKGLGVTMLRSFPVNGIGFVSFQVTMSFLGKGNQNKNFSD